MNTEASIQEEPLSAAPQAEVKTQPTQQPLASPLLTKKRGINGTQLKILAIVIMTIDHIGAIAMMPFMMAMPTSMNSMLLNMALRCIGRMGFPIFCFLLVQGFLHTHDVKKYALRLAGFAVISEFAFDLATNDTLLEVTYQNVFFTLLCGLLAIWGIDKLRGKVWLQVLAAAACALAAELLRTDYAAMGVITIILFYVLRNHKKAMYWAVGVWLCLGMVISHLPDAVSALQGQPLYIIIIGAFANGLLELLGAFSFFFLVRYNGERGAKLPKYLFYAFYPVHLLVLYGVAQLLARVLH